MLLALGLAASAGAAGVYLWTGAVATESLDACADASVAAKRPPAIVSHEARNNWKRKPCDGVKEPRRRWSINPPRESPDTRRGGAQFRWIVAKRTCRARPCVYTNLGGSCKARPGSGRYQDSDWGGCVRRSPALDRGLPSLRHLLHFLAVVARHPARRVQGG